eukprot:CAMPEP_0194388432 /NCGR_PEP_ID=MMETSP0174-20130528/98599_1 /TAXON_ID=216777 /ORGANISM="Proboscia alata, Strain PI-D3" /LENGTH=343 /DNA_ID=CAMNT_0039179711 /DNA_START=25 /DNA_END=1056 /DNA_ORIENTATION=+
MTENTHETNLQCNDSVTCFQDIFCEDEKSRKRARKNITTESNDCYQSNSASNAFFEMANSKFVGYMVSGRDHCGTKRKKTKQKVIVKQHCAVSTHTGGIVWETSYLLAKYLESTLTIKSKSPILQDDVNTGDELHKNYPLNRTLEIGSGCGLLGITLAALGLSRNVVLTEHTDVMPILVDNIKRNIQLGTVSPSQVTAQQLRWECSNEDIASSSVSSNKGGNNNASSATKNKETSRCLCKGSFDTIVGTDVLFTPSLVKPLIATLRKLSHSQTQILLCLQERCVDSYQLFIKNSKKYFSLEDLSGQFSSVEGCGFGVELECILLRLTPLMGKTKKKKKKKSKH